MRFLLASGLHFLLAFEPPLLVGRVIQLRIAIHHFRSTDYQLQPPDRLALGVALFCQRRYVDGMVRNERRIHQMRTADLLEYLVSYLAFGCMRRNLDAEAPRRHAEGIGRFDLVVHDERVAFKNIRELNAREFFPERYGFAVKRDFPVFYADALQDMQEALFHARHHLLLVPVGSIPFDGREFGIMGDIDALIPETLAEFIDLFKSAHQKLL